MIKERMRKLFRFVLVTSAAFLPFTLFAETSGGALPSVFAKCLPVGIKLSNIVEAVNGRKITVEQKLRELNATCDRGSQLSDGKGRPIAFYHLQGCWGYPPPNYQEIMQKQQREIERLKQRHAVIEMTCNPSGIHRP